MTIKVWATVIALALSASPAAFAAPAVKPEMRSNAQAEQVACWWRNGVRRCNGARVYRRGNPYDGYRTYGYRAPYLNYGNPRPEDLPFGSTEWWRAMDRDGKGGYRR